MNDLLPLISRLKKLDIGVQLVDDQLKFNAPEGVLTPGIINELKDKKAQIIDFLRKRFKKRVKFKSMEPVEKKEYYALSSAQKRLYVLQQMDPGGIAYNIPFALMLEGNINKEKLADIFQCLIKRHESMRTSFHSLEHEPVQRVHHDVEFEIEYDQSLENCQGRGEVPLPIKVEKIIRDFIRPFDLSKAPLVRVGLIKLPHPLAALRGHPRRGTYNYQEGKEGRYLLMVDMHHIVSDGVSMEILNREFMALSRGERLAPLPIQYKDYTQWQTGKELEGRTKIQENYWLNMYPDEIPLLNLPFDYPRPALQSFVGSRVSFNIGEKETAALNKLASEQGGTLYMVLFAVFIVLLSKLSGQDDIVVGTAVANRFHADLHGIIGMFVNTLALRNRVDSESSFRELSSQVKEKILKAFENQGYPFEKLVEKVAINRDTSRNPLFDVMFSMQNIGKEAALKKDETASYQVQSFEFDTGITHFDLMLNGVERDDQLLFAIEYCSKLFKEETILRFISFFKRILSDIQGLKDRKVSEIVILSEEEKQLILYDFNDTVTDYPGNKTIHALFDEQVDKLPDHTAVVFEEESITYRELMRRAEGLAVFLYAKGSKEEDAVGIMLKGCLEMVIAVMGILKGGGCYLPINIKYPQERKTFILKDSHCRILLTDEVLSSASTGVEVINVRNLEYEALPTVERDDAAHIGGTNDRPAVSLAYIIYTSGSTGNPKGVLVEHKNVVRLVKNPNYIDFPGEYRLLQTGALEFDASTFEIWGALLNGRSLYLVNEDTVLTPKKLKERIQRYEITTMWMTSPLFNQMLDTDMEIFIPLKNLLVGGDVLSPLHINRARERFPRLNLINGYGPTENTTFSTTYSIKKGFKEKIPIGKPIANSSAYIVDRNDQLVPVGITGELIVGGDGLARGYLNNPELTCEKFKIINYKLKIKNGNSKKVYKTGDLARWLPDGNIEFLGRIDHQVKIRGFRIEPGEIEIHLLSHDDIHEAVVLTKKDENGDKYLCAYIVSRRNLQSLNLRTFLSTRLPDYMIPSCFVLLERIPLTTNGKVDRRALPKPELKDDESYTAPQDGIEKKLVDIWAGVLGIEKEKIGINSNFFKVGGHSLKAIIMAAKIHKFLNLRISITDMFKNPTIRGMAKIIKEKKQVNYENIKPLPPQEYYEVFHAHPRLYKLSKNNTAYDIHFAFQVKGYFEIKILEKAFRSLIQRHEILRTTFVEVNGELKLKVHNRFDFEIDYRDFRNSKNKESKAKNLLNDQSKRFNLSKLPLFRVTALQFENNNFIILLTISHMLTDAWGLEVLTRELLLIYDTYKENKDNPLKPLDIQYKEIVSWQNKRLRNGNLNKERDYWLSRLKGKIPLMNLKTDYPWPGVRRFFNGGSVTHILDKNTTEGFKNLSENFNNTLFITFLAMVNVLLHKISGQKEVIVSTNIAQRDPIVFMDQIGLFVNILVLKNKINEEMSFIDFLSQVKNNTLQAYENKNYPYSQLVEDLKVKPEPGRHPLFDVVVTLVENNPEANNQFYSETYSIRSIPDYQLGKVNRNKYDFSLIMIVGVQFQVTIKYNRDLFKEISIIGFKNQLDVLIKEVVSNPGKKIKNLVNT